MPRNVKLTVEYKGHEIDIEECDVDPGFSHYSIYYYRNGLRILCRLGRIARGTSESTMVFLCEQSVDEMIREERNALIMAIDEIEYEQRIQHQQQV